MSDNTDVQALKAQLKAIQDAIKAITKQNKSKSARAVEAANELKVHTDNIKAAKNAYRDKGFDVEIETDEETGLIKKWKLKNRFPKKNLEDGGTSTRTSSGKPALKVEELEQVIPQLPEGPFSGKDIGNALIKAGIGERNLQPTLGNYINKMFGPPKIRKADNTPAKGPGVRYQFV